MTRAVLLVEDAQGDVVALGPFTSQETARAFEDRNPQLSVVGCPRLLPASSPLAREAGVEHR